MDFEKIEEAIRDAEEFADLDCVNNLITACKGLLECVRDSEKHMAAIGKKLKHLEDLVYSGGPQIGCN